MRDRHPPAVDSRRRAELRAELTERARVWLPDWQPRDGRADFATALLEIAARVSAEATQRLNRTSEKAFRGYLHWLAVRGRAGRAARMPVVFVMSQGAEPVLAPAGVQLQAVASETPVTFETSAALRVVPGGMASLVGADPAGDAFFQPTSGVLSLTPPSGGPDEWRVKSRASAGATQLQLEPELGLDGLPTLFHEGTGLEYRVTAANGGIVTIEPPLGTTDGAGSAPTADTGGLEVGERLTRVVEFRPFQDVERNRQEHFVYLGSKSALSLEASATIAIAYDGIPIGQGVEWAYWGMAEGDTVADWQPLPSTVDDGGRVVLRKAEGSVELVDIEGHNSRWLRGRLRPGGTDRALSVARLRMTVNCEDDIDSVHCPPGDGEVESRVELEALANTTPLVLNALPFYPLGREPRLFDIFYLGSAEAFSKRGARVRICFQRGDGRTAALMASQIGESGDSILFAIGRDGHLQRLLPGPDGSLVRLPPLRPPLTENGVARPAVPPVRLNRLQQARLTAVSRARDTIVAVTAGNDAWLWRQSREPGASRWYPGGTIPTKGAIGLFEAGEPPTVMVLRDGEGLRLIGLSRGRLYEARLRSGWETAGVPRWQAVVAPGSRGRQWRQLAPVFDQANRFRGPDVRDGWLAIDDRGRIDLWTDSACITLTDGIQIATTVAPLGLRQADGTILVVAQVGGGGVTAWRVDDGKAAQVIATQPGVTATGSFDWDMSVRDDPAIIFVDETRAESGQLQIWRPFLQKLTSRSVAGLAGAPTVLRGRVIVPGLRPDHLVLDLDAAVEASSTRRMRIVAAPPAGDESEQGASGDPRLSWEYWDGHGWWRIEGLEDGTGNFVRTGAVAFCVPPDLQPTDVAGRSNHWIRARLAAGDYGRETITITSTTNGSTTQTVNRSIEGIDAPRYVAVDLRYSLCRPALPDVVLTKDGGGVRDQSDANRTPGAAVELFMPLAETISRAGRGAGEPRSTAGDASTSAPAASERCGDRWQEDGGTSAVAAKEPAGSEASAVRALYVGFSARFDGGPIAILFIVEEGTHDGAYPLQLEVLRGGRFERVGSVQDGTRGLNESGTITFSLSDPPQPSALFGRDACWVRLSPRPGFNSESWQPVIRAAYVNGVFAQAAETQSIEVLGSSDGSPNQRVSLARSPVLAESLQLRVRELLDEDEVTALNREEPDRVVEEVGGRPGPWVLWKEVVDPNETAEQGRVYSLDDEKGEIQFGGPGRIPPIGRDSIVAVRYERGGGDAANKVRAWSPLNLITPLQGVEAAATPMDAAGGADPQSAEAVMRFASANQFLRDRALTLRDLELVALQFSPDVAQVHALARRRGVDLVVAMKGQDPSPSAAQRRELGRFLADRTLPTLSGQQGLRIVAPELIEMSVRIGVVIEAIEHSGAVAEEARKRLTALVDPATGGLDHAGWPLSQVPRHTDIAASLDGTEHLEAVTSIALERIQPQVAPSELPTRLKPTQLIHLAQDRVRVDCALATSEVQP